MNSVLRKEYVSNGQRGQAGIEKIFFLYLEVLEERQVLLVDFFHRSNLDLWGNGCRGQVS